VRAFPARVPRHDIAREPRLGIGKALQCPVKR
jgi:hypothetical protein